MVYGPHTLFSLLWPYIRRKTISIKGDVRVANVPGTDCSQPQRCYVYVPEGYDHMINLRRRYRVLYHLHGARAKKSWAKYDCMYLGRTVEEADEKGRLTDPMIVVVPLDPSPNKFSMWSDSHDGKCMASTGFRRDVISYIDETYRTVADRSGRVLQGFGMGGFGAVVNAFLSPELFSAVLVWDGTMHDYENYHTKRPVLFAATFGSEEYFKKFSPYELTSSSAGRGEKEGDERARSDKLDLYIIVGNKDKQIADMNDSFKDHLENNGVEFQYSEVACNHSLFALMHKVEDKVFPFIQKSCDKHDKKKKR